MMRRWAGHLGTLILACVPVAALDASELPFAADLRTEARLAAAAGGPLVVLYSRADCRFCRTLRRNYLAPLATPAGGQLVVREIAQDSTAPLTDFTGRTSTQAAFAAAAKIRLVPVVAFYGADGRQLAEPIVGARLGDFYQSYLDDALAKAQRALQRP